MTAGESKQLAQQLMTQHGLVGWTFHINNNKSRRGVCRYKQKRIEISRHLLTLADNEVRDTTLHEIAHALLPSGHHHDRVWRRKARELGCTPRSCGASMNVPARFKGTCPHCSKVIVTHRRSRRACAKCCNTLNHGRFDPQFCFIWSNNN